MNTTTCLIWNGCDAYRIAQDGEVAYSRTEAFSAFPVGAEVDAEDVPRDEDGELNYAGMYVTDQRRIFRAA